MPCPLYCRAVRSRIRETALFISLRYEYVFIVQSHLLKLIRYLLGTGWALRCLRWSFWLDEKSKRITSSGFIVELNFIFIDHPLCFLSIFVRSRLFIIHLSWNPDTSFY